MPIAVTFGVKRKIIGVVSLIVIFAFLGSILVIERPQDPNFRDYKVQVNEVFKDAKTQFEHLRGVTLPADVTVSVYTKQQAIDRWGQDSSNVDTSSVIRQENIFKSLFLISEDESLNGTMADWVASWTAATVGHEIYVIYENFWPWDITNAEATLIHELTHVWQNSLPSATNYDNNKAQNALIEGDASYTTNYYYYKTQHNNTNNNNDGSASSGDVSNLENSYQTNLSALLLCTPGLYLVYPEVSSIVANLNQFPYIQGKTFVSKIVDTYGWERLNQCYTTPTYMPSSTEQILHPDKYFAGETAKNVIAPTPADDSWTLIPSSYGYSSDTYGEYFIYIMLRQWLNDNQAQKAATGWGGDNATYYEKDTDYLFIWNITWDTTQDASEFNQAFTDMLKHTPAKPQNNNNTYNNNQWLTNNRYITLTWNPNTQTTLITCSNNKQPQI